uniref:receptor protein-tyrosine kinase n=1 Tax=Ditylenchus dipsaci TaxID=166011 RepID=A0A915D678_9BILA
MLPRYASDNARKEFMFEIEIMKSLGYNENIANMLGCITTGQTICLEEVDLVESIDDKMAFTKDFLLFAWQISDGMVNLTRIIHRDLAARNILIDAERNAKICDFGLCITINNRVLPTFEAHKVNSKVSTSGRLPIKWLALECFQRQEFSTKTDVWSFGILLYELYSFGGQPYEDIEPSCLQAHLEQGNRLLKTQYCPEEIYQLMQKCWFEDPDDRPSFQELLTLFTVFLERATEGYGYLSLLKTNAEHYSKLDKLALAREYHHNLDRRRSSLKPGSSNASVSKDLCERLNLKLPKLPEDDDDLSNYSV